MRNLQVEVRVRVIYSIISSAIFCILLYNSSTTKLSHNEIINHRRITQEFHNTSFPISNGKFINLLNLKICPEFHNHDGYQTTCDFLLENPTCTWGGFFNYIKIFYCNCQKYPFLGYITLAIWLAILFYLLGNTATNYFCCSLENLSNLLKMSPTIAGVTLLPLGNGASDVFASIAAFMSSGSSNVGLNGVLGGAVFITCVVVGVVSLSVADKRVQIDNKCFIRDVCFLLFSVLCLTLIVTVGNVSVWGAVCFVSMYFAYAGFVVVVEVLKKNSASLKSDGVITPLLPVTENNEIVTINTEDDNEEEESGFNFAKLCSFLEMVLNFPRRLTIPIIEEDRWSKMFGISSTFLAPSLIAFLWNTQEKITPLSGKLAYLIGFIIGFILSVLASVYTKTDHPPRKFLFPWIFGGFFMSIIWFYIIASELVSLLVSLGTIFGISPSILALTVLAWGNSMNDLMSNTAFAMNERNGVQIAMSGCYAGPMFNTLVGLGLSLVLGAWSNGSEPYVIDRDMGLFVTLGFLTAGVVWSLVVLPRNDMRPGKVLGVGLIGIYVVFLCVSVGMAIGIGSRDG